MRGRKMDLTTQAVLSVLLLLYGISLVASQSRIRWCTISGAEQLKCEDMVRNFTARRLSPQLRCVQARHRFECMRWISEDRADLVRVDDTDFFAAGQFYNLTAILAEKYTRVRNEEPFRYKAVAIIKANGPITSMESLRGRKSCHTGVDKTAGWTVPVANLVAKRLVTLSDCGSSVRAVVDFFSESCAPGAFDPENNPYGNNPINVCALCRDPSTCSKDDVYSGYVGAFRCLHEGDGEVAFVSHTTFNDATADYVNRRTTPPNAADYRLLCPDGRVDFVNNWANCSWATRPSDTIVTALSKPAETMTLYRSLLVRASRFFGPISREFRMFNSANYAGEDLLFSDITQSLVRLDPAVGYRQLMDQGYLNTMFNYTNCNTDLRWCVTSKDEEVKCKDMEAAFTANRITRSLRCVRSRSENQCLQKINQNEADLMAVGGTGIYNGGRYNSAVPIATESERSFGEGLDGYWAVAVVRKDSDININNLRGRTSCHTGIAKSVGWNIPVGHLLSTNEIAANPCNVTQEVGSFFSRSCVPGALEEKYNPNGTNPQTMCSLCGGPDKCARNSSNPFFSYTGAFRCFVQFNADVAFVAHTTVPQNTDGRNSEPWARTRRSRDFELLCPDGTRQPVSSWKTCNLGRAPSHAVVTRQATSTETRQYYYNVLLKAQLLFGSNSTAKFNLFNSPVGTKDLIFRDSTAWLQWIPPQQQTYKEVLGKEYTNILKSLDRRQCANAAISSSAKVSTFTLLTSVVIVLKVF